MLAAIDILKISDLHLNLLRYAWEGCFTVIVDTIEENQGIVSGVAIGVVAVMVKFLFSNHFTQITTHLLIIRHNFFVLQFLNMLFSFAMCTMVN